MAKTFFFFWSSPELGAKSVIQAEDSTNLRRRPFFWPSPEYEVNFHQIAAAFRMRLVMAAKASPHAILYSINAGPTRELNH